MEVIAVSRIFFVGRVLAAVILATTLVANTIALAASWEAFSKDELSTKSTFIVASDTTEFVLPDSNARLYTANEAQQLDDWELVTAINELYARQGLIFNDPDVAEYFQSKSWYVPTRAFDDFEESSPFNYIEQQNVNTLAEERDRRGL